MWTLGGKERGLTYAIHNPTMVIVPCILKSIPLFPGLHISDWYIGIVDELKPFPTPVTILPTRSCARVVEDPSNIVPIIIVVPPAIIILFLPNLSPKKKAKRQPAAQPIS